MNDRPAPFSWPETLEVLSKWLVTASIALLCLIALVAALVAP